MRDSTFDLTRFRKGESVVIYFSAKDANDAVLPDASNVTVTVTLSYTNGRKISQFDAAPEVTLTDPANAKWTINLPPSATAELTPEREYNYDIWTTLADGTVLHQAGGRFVLGISAFPA